MDLRVCYIKFDNNRPELQKKKFTFHDYKFKPCSWKKIPLPCFLHMDTYNTHVSGDCAVCKVVHPSFSLDIMLQVLLDVSRGFCRTFLQSNASRWLWVLAAGCWQ